MKNPDLHAYVLGELTEAERKEAELFIASDPEAGLEVERLRLVTACMRSVAEEEPSRRIAFVSDKVFEPSWFARLWNSSAKLGFVSAAMLAGAILAHGWMSRPVVSAPPVVQISQADVARQVEAEVSKRLDSALTKAVAEVRDEQDGKSQRLVAVALQEAEKKFVMERRADRLAVESSMDTLRKQLNRVVSTMYADNRVGGKQ